MGTTTMPVQHRKISGKKRCDVGEKPAISPRSQSLQDNLGCGLPIKHPLSHC